MSALFAVSLTIVTPAVANPWDDPKSIEELTESVVKAFPLKGSTVELHGKLVSYEGWHGTIAERKNVGDDFFCDFQIREDLGKNVTIEIKDPIKIVDVEPYMGADQELSRIGIFLTLSRKTITGADNPIELLACIRNQQRDQIPEGWTLTRESTFTMEDLTELIKGRISIKPAASD